jgi:signal transduction histidine kinase
MSYNYLQYKSRGTPKVIALARPLISTVGLAAAIGLSYFLVAQLGLRLLTDSGVAVFWPAAGISSGILIARGPAARWPVVLGTIIGTIPANLYGDRNVWAAVAFALCDATEALITAGLIQRFLGGAFDLGRLRNVLGLLFAAIGGTAISGIGGTIAFRVFYSPTTAMLTTWHHWFASDLVGIISIAPLVIGVAAAAREPPARNELIEGVAALSILAAMTAIIILLPPEPWETVVPAALVFPMLVWLAARCCPVFAATGAFLVSLALVWTTTFGIGHFGDPSLPIDDRIMQAEALILVVTLGAQVLAALFSERRESEARLAQSKALLERERDNKLTSLEAAMAALAHEVKQPLTAIAAKGSAGRRFLDLGTSNVARVKTILDDIVESSFRINEIFGNMRALFKSGDQEQHPVDVNDLVYATLQLLHKEFEDGGIVVRINLTTRLPNVVGHRGQLQEVIFNLVQNSIDAMEGIRGRSKILKIKTESHGDDAIAIAVEDTGSGIEPQRLEGIFDPFVTTKASGTGLGLAISKMIVERHGGRLTGSSDGKSGALFRVELPFLAADNAAAAASDA